MQNISRNMDEKMSDAIQRRCKNVIGKLQSRIDKEGPYIVPLLTDLWKRIGSSETVKNVINLRKIDLRVDKLEYNGVMDLISDVQYMLKSSMQYFGFLHEVRSEARKMHDLFFDILKIAFPDIDFKEARTALSWSSASTSTPSSKRTIIPGQSKRQKLINEPEPKTYAVKHPSCTSLSNVDEPRGSRVHMLQKASRVGPRIRKKLGRARVGLTHHLSSEGVVGPEVSVGRIL